MNERDEMIISLKKNVVPLLRQKGFKGSFPHFRRASGGYIDLLTFQFDRWGGGFVVEIAVCYEDGVTMHWGEKIPPNKVTAHHINKRYRLGAKDTNSDYWFRYDINVAFGNSFDIVAKELIDKLGLAEKWFLKLRLEM